MADNIPAGPESRPVSLRGEDTVNLSSQNQSGAQRFTFLVAAGAVIAFIVILIVLVSGGDSNDKASLTEDEVRQIVQEVVGTQIAALPVSGGSVNGPQVQAMIDSAVNTKVAALVPTSTPIPPTPTLIPRGVAEEDDAFLGPENAPVVIVEFSDFQCGYCGRWYQETLSQILEAYPNEVKFVYRDFPIFGDDSIRAAMASECADDQGKFWDMHNRLFEHTVDQEQTPLSEETLNGFAEELGLDQRSFAECLANEVHLGEIQADYQTAVAYGLRGTPGFVIDGVVYAIGAQSFDVFDSIIRQQLAKNESSEG